MEFHHPWHAQAFQDISGLPLKPLLQVYSLYTQSNLPVWGNSTYSSTLRANATQPQRVSDGQIASLTFDLSLCSVWPSVMVFPIFCLMALLVFQSSCYMGVFLKLQQRKTQVITEPLPRHFFLVLWPGRCHHAAFMAEQNRIKTPSVSPMAWSQ